MPFRAKHNGQAGVSVMNVEPDYVAGAGEVLFAAYPSPAELAAAFPDLVLSQAQASALVTISTEAENARLRFVTPGSGKAMAYQEKAAEAKAFVAAASPAPEDYPILASEIGVTADSLAGVAAIVLGRYNAFKVIEAAIGGTEAAGKKAVAEAVSADAIDAIVAALTWPEP